MKFHTLLVFLAAAVCLPSVADVVINEIAYNPPDDGIVSGSFKEFIELYNPGSEPVDLTGYYFTKGLTYAFPEGTIVSSGDYIILVRDNTQRDWRRPSAPVVGPFEGALSDGGERIELARPDGTIVESVRYDDRFPWPLTADGYGSTLERIAWDLPADDFHSWRASLMTNGTPGEANSIIGTNPRPVMTAYEVNPSHPTSSDSVTVRLGFDAADIIDSATLQWEKASQGGSGYSDQPEIYLTGYDSYRYWKGSEAPSEGDEWTKPEFDDSSWLVGEGMHGYGSIDMLATQLRDMRGNYSSVYLRREFSIPNANSLQNAYLYVFYSGGFVCHLNGVEIARAGVPQSATHETLAAGVHNVNDYVIYQIENTDGLFQERGNVIAVAGFSSDLNRTSFGVAVFLMEGDSTGGDDGSLHQVAMERVAESVNGATFEAQIPPTPSQSLIRFNARVTTSEGFTQVLPYVSELRPFESYFVYDGEIESQLPVLWPYNSSGTELTEMQRVVSGAVILPVGAERPLVFDGALLYPSRNGQKLKFLKGEEYRNDRTLNILPESPQGGTTSGSSTPFREELGFWFFREFGVPAPRTDWYRVITGDRHTQQLLIQQVNEKCLEMNGLNPDADLFKRNYVSPYWEPHTNMENGTDSIDLLTRNIRKYDRDALHEAVTENLVWDEWMAYIVASVLSSNWDGFHNNHWMYLDPDTQKWQIIPWDLDKAWGYTDSNPMFAEMPIEFPLNGRAQHASRETGPITGWVMKDDVFYEEYVNRLGAEFNNAFSEERMFAKIDEREQYLLADLALLEESTGDGYPGRRQQIENSYELLRTFVRLRREYLQPFLPTPVSNWSLY